MSNLCVCAPLPTPAHLYRRPRACIGVCHPYLHARIQPGARQRRPSCDPGTTPARSRPARRDRRVLARALSERGLSATSASGICSRTQRAGLVYALSARDSLMLSARGTRLRPQLAGLIYAFSERDSFAPSRSSVGVAPAVSASMPSAGASTFPVSAATPSNRAGS
ncbi:hypothetical protein BD626DRAFT_171723 [Schizophyllum amplum]|uniref:Uncharacterized protein n=1 Tax=Schizophyllum amplum TaxID=97359 RepID=A0A550CR53_9AGAR|nr:hypothetical protein BD626DRAFT_171723 [Auriculariopsis ampla]